MTWYEFWLVLHLSAVIVWGGGGAAIQVSGVLTKRADGPAKTAFFAENVSKTVNFVFLPAAIVVLGAGVGLVENGGSDWGEPFITWGLLLWALVALVAFGYLGREIGRAGRRLEAEGPSPALGLKLRNLVWISRGLVVMLFLIVFLMTIKPGT